MALKPCPRCGKMISDKAERCPKCGLDEKNFSSSENSQELQNVSPPPTAENRIPQGSPQVTEDNSYERNYPYNEQPKKSKTGLWICLGIILVIGIGAAIWIPIYRHNEKLKAEHLALLEQQRLDSIAAVEAELARLEQQRRDSIRINFRSPDLSFFELHGPVKTVKGGISIIGRHPNEEINKIDFDKNGKALFESSGSFNSGFCGKIGWKITRNKEDQIISISFNSYEGLSCYHDAIKFKWENNKIVKQDLYALYGNTHIKYYYDSNGFLEKIVLDLREEEGFEDTPVFETRKITDYELDKYGNWISRKVNNEIQTREITYYED